MNASEDQPGRRHPWHFGTVGVTSAAAGVLALVVVVAWIVPSALARHDIGSLSYSRLTPAEQSQAVNAVRETLLQALGALAVGVAGIVGWRQLGINRRQVVLSSRQLDSTSAANRVQHELARQSLISQRLTTSVEQLGSDKLAVRVGGVYGVELVASASAEQRDVVMEILCAFIRASSGQLPDIARGHRLPVVLWTASQLTHPTLGVREPDRQAALRVLGRLTSGPIDHQDLFDRTDRRVLDLERAVLHRSDLTLGRFDGGSFHFCDLRGTNMSGAFFESANFVWATLAGANLAGASLLSAAFDEADLRNADFTGSQLAGATFDGADISGAIFDRADLAGVDMTSADNAQLASFAEVTVDGRTKLPTHTNSTLVSPKARGRRHHGYPRLRSRMWRLTSSWRSGRGRDRFGWPGRPLFARLPWRQCRSVRCSGSRGPRCAGSRWRWRRPRPGG